MKKYLTKRNLYIGLFVILYLLVGIVSLFHSFAFFGLANNGPMSIMLGCCFEIGQVAVLMSLLTSKKDRGRVMPWILMCILTLVQIIGNIFSSYKYMMTNATNDLIYFKNPIFIWTDLPDDITTVIVTYIIGALLPIIALCMTSMVSNYIMDDDPNDNKELIEDNKNDLPEIKTEQMDNESKSMDPTEIDRKSINDNNESINVDNHEQEKDEPETIEETEQDPDSKGDDELLETNNRVGNEGSEEVHQDVKGTDEDDTKKVELNEENHNPEQETKESHFLNI